MQKPNCNIEICDTLRRGFPNSNCTGFPIPAALRVHWTNFYWIDVCIQKPYAVAIVQLIQIECNLLVCNHNSHTMYIVSTPTVMYCKFFRHHCSHNCPFKILYCKLLSTMEQVTRYYTACCMAIEKELERDREREKDTERERELWEHGE